jgi:hypothetical protein
MSTPSAQDDTGTGTGTDTDASAGVGVDASADTEGLHKWLRSLAKLDGELGAAWLAQDVPAGVSTEKAVARLVEVLRRHLGHAPPTRKCVELFLALATETKDVAPLGATEMVRALTEAVSAFPASSSIAKGAVEGAKEVTGKLGNAGGAWALLVPALAAALEFQFCDKKLVKLAAFWCTQSTFAGMSAHTCADMIPVLDKALVVFRENLSVTRECVGFFAAMAIHGVEVATLASLLPRVFDAVKVHVSYESLAWTAAHMCGELSGHPEALEALLAVVQHLINMLHQRHLSNSVIAECVAACFTRMLMNMLKGGTSPEDVLAFSGRTAASVVTILRIYFGGEETSNLPFVAMAYFQNLAGCKGTFDIVLGHMQDILRPVEFNPKDAQLVNSAAGCVRNLAAQGPDAVARLVAESRALPKESGGALLMRLLKLEKLVGPDTE